MYDTHILWLRGPVALASHCVVLCTYCGFSNPLLLLHVRSVIPDANDVEEKITPQRHVLFLPLFRAVLSIAVRALSFASARRIF